MNSKAVGEISEANILAEFMNAGYAVSIPFGNNQRYDMIVESVGSDGRLWKVQCKTGRLRDGSIDFPCSNITYGNVRKDYQGQVDIFAVFCVETGRVYLVPAERCGSSSVSIRVSYPKNNQLKTVLWAADCILGDVPSDHFKIGRDDVPDFIVKRRETVGAKEYHERTRKINLTSEELHGMVWSKPIREVAAGLGVSDTAVKKACKRLNVDTPKQGYWLKR